LIEEFKMNNTMSEMRVFNSWDDLVSQSDPPAPAVQAVCQGLTSISESTAQLADHLRTHPADWESVSEQATGVNQNLTGLVASMKSYAAGSEQLWTATSEASAAAEGGNSTT
jgi:uncharacterized phage infection (PIP) family protein YhgE